MFEIKNNARIVQIKKGESRWLELKSKLPASENIAKTAVAFSNGAGGEIIIGVEENGKIAGISDGELFELQDKISNILHDMCHPTIIPEIFVEAVEGKNIIIVKIVPGGLKPYHLKKYAGNKGTYIRIGATNKQADAEFIEELERRRKNISFDEEIDYDLDFKKLDYSFLVKKFKEIKNKKISLNDLLNLKLVKKEHNKIFATKALSILSGAAENARANCARFKGNTAEIFIDKKEFDGDVFAQIENAEIFLKNHLRLSGRINGFVREDKYEIPFVALREAIVNAFVHRDYSRRGCDIKIAVFDDMIEITSPGMLPNSISLENILNDGRSEIRNIIIARVFKELNYIEQWGTGMAKIKNSCESAGLKTPLIRENGGYTQAVLFRPADTGGYRRMPADTGGSTEIKGRASVDGAQEQDEAIVKYVECNGEINLKTVMKLLVLKESRARELLGNLVKTGKLVKKGSARSTFYVIGE